MIKAASVARGELVGVASDSGHIVHVPRYLADTHTRTCFAFKSFQSADCEMPAGNPTDVVEATTTAGLYNPLYYIAVGWPTLFLSGDVAVYAMRIVSGALSMLFMALAATTISGWRRPALPLLGLFAGMTPVFLFLSGTVNPNTLEVTATVALFVGMLSIVLHPANLRLATQCALVAASGAVALNTRGLAAVWVLIAIVVPLCVASRHDLKVLLRKREVLWAIAAVGIATVVSLAWLFGSSSLFAGLDSDKPSTVPWAGSSALSGWWLMITGTFRYGEQMVGIFGWLDTPTADVVYFVWATFTGAIAIWALAVLRGSRLFAGILLMAAFVVVPALIQAAYITDGGLIWQGRYNLPAFICMTVGLTAFAAFDMSSSVPQKTSKRITLVVIGVWAAAQLVAFATTVQRYAVGLEGTWVATFLRPDWSAPLGNAGIVSVFGVLLIAIFFAIAKWHDITHRSNQSPSELEPSSGSIHREKENTAL